MMDTVDRLVRLLDVAEARAAKAEARAEQLAKELMFRPHKIVDGDALAKELGHIAGGSKINAIRLHRQFTDSPLKDAKDAVERWWPAVERNGRTVGTSGENISAGEPSD